MTDASPGPNASAARILIVDDDERNLLALSQVCEPVAGVVCVSSGRDALRQLLREDFAVILLDVFMPDLDGYETAALIRERAQSARIPIIFLSAVNKETEHLMRGYAMGAVDYVFKPVDPIVLRSKVSVFVDLFQMRRQLELSERRQASILRALPMAIYEVTEKDGLLLRRFHGGDLTRFLGDEAEAVSRNERAWEDWVHPDDRELLYSEPERGGDTVTVEYRWIGPGGARHHILDQRIATTKATGERRWAGSLLDITERKELEARLVHAGKIDALGQLTGGGRA
ncbi:response regulator [Tsuneonella troitsensis]|uniref:response regulator n=1 Tax=Tsuneonella troitsensis TaxID=292222 RepID=UPI000F4ADDC5|nr:response regulator [Tsuneonella troitsensis]